ncbi:MAG: solute:sodium symporter family transporter [Verrucomicrobiales bacterium]
MPAWTLISFVFFTALVAFLTWKITRGKGTDTEDGFFLAGRSLTGLVIAGSLLLTNLSTEQLVGLNGGAFLKGLSVMAWEVIAGCALVALALFFLPRYLKSGITTIPQFLEERYGAGTRALTTGIFIIAYMLILLPFVLFSGASALAYMLDLPTQLGLSDTATIWLVVAFIALVGSAYAIFGGLRAVAVSDTFNGLGLLIGGILITYFSLRFAAGAEGSIFGVFSEIKAANPDAFVSLGKAGEDEHWPTLFTGILLLNFFYWTTNQQIIQRTFAAKNLAEGQKGVLLAAFFKILAPLILVIPGIVALHLANNNVEFNELLLNQQGERADSRVYGALVHTVLPAPLTGFFAAVVVGSILSTFNSVLNSSATLFSLGVYKTTIKPGASNREVVASGRWCSALVALCAALGAPLIFMGRDGIFNFFQNLNAIYFIPLLAIIMVGMFEKRADGRSAIITACVGLLIMLWGTFTGSAWVAATFGSAFHFMGLVFLLLVGLQLLLGTRMRLASPYVQRDAQVVDLTPWPHANKVGLGLVTAVIVVYLLLAR